MITRYKLNIDHNGTSMLARHDGRWCKFSDLAAKLDDLRDKETAQKQDIIDLGFEVNRLERQLADWKASQNYRYIGKDGKPVMARQLEDERDRLREDNERLRERLLAAEYVLKQSRPDSGYLDAYAKEALK